MQAQLKINSPWREFSFMLHQLQGAIAPVLSLQKIITQWGEIGASLAERPRQRQLQSFKFKAN